MASDYQYDFDGLVYGSGTSILVERVTGLLSFPTLEVTDTPRADHGAVPGIPRMGPKVIEFDLHILKGTLVNDIEAKLAAFQDKFQPPSLDNPRELKLLKFKRPGIVEKRLSVRCDKRDFASTYAVAQGHAAGSVQLTAPDPVIYSEALKTLPLTLVAADLSETGTATNAGNHRDGVKPSISITGPCRDPFVQNSTSGKYLLFSGLDVQAGQTLVIDFIARTATIAGVSKMLYLHDASRWFTLLPGPNLIAYSRGAGALTGASSTMTMTWRDGWT